jgi:hypothetical protein
MAPSYRFLVETPAEERSQFPHSEQTAPFSCKKFTFFLATLSLTNSSDYNKTIEHAIKVHFSES